MRCVTRNGKVTPLMSNDVTLFIASMQASKGDRHTYHPAQKNPIGQAIRIRTKNQMTPHSTPFALIFNHRIQFRAACETAVRNSGTLIDMFPVRKQNIKDPLRALPVRDVSTLFYCHILVARKVPST